MQKKWKICAPDPQKVLSLSRATGISPIVSGILINRGYSRPEQIGPFLNPSLADLTAPFSLLGIASGAARLHQAFQNKERILVFGDYDVDGVTATAILYQFLKQVGAHARWYIPHRITEGYGFKPGQVIDRAAADGISLIVTADCGSTSHDAVQAAADRGIDTIVTDHHEMCNRIPEAVAVINPKRPDCTADLEALSGAGVAFYLVVGLRAFLRDKSFWGSIPEPNLREYCDLVALGTTADLVPLIGANRILVKTGLAVINRAPREGLAALAKQSACQPGQIDESDLAFRLCPRLNAAGRIDHAKTAFDLLISNDRQSAFNGAYHLDQLNALRRETEAAIFTDIRSRIPETPSTDTARPLVLHSSDWHEGVLGIVASRLVEAYHCPVVLISTKSGMGKGSARSIPGINLYEALLACAHHLEIFGGHAMAAGLTIQPHNIEALRNCLSEKTDRMAAGLDIRPQLSIDAELDFRQISALLANELERLKPFGPMNREPLFMSRNVQVLSSQIVAKKHCRMVLAQGGKELPAIWFNAAHGQANAALFARLAFHVRWNRWNGKKTLQLQVTETETAATG